MNTDQRKPPEPRPAATLILVEEGKGDIQVYLTRRNSRSRAFAGDYVFPGGTLSAQDLDWELWKDHVDLGYEELSRLFCADLTLEEAIAFGVAAIRETFEEAGVLLARGCSGEGMGMLCQHRLQEGLPEGWFLEQVASENWELQFSALIPWSHWVTPRLMPKRFDTRFFLAPMPKGQTCVPDARETTHGVWVSPGEALAGNLAGEIPLSPPTLVTLHEMMHGGDLAQLRRGPGEWSWDVPRYPRLVPSERGPFLLQPWDPASDESIPVDPERFSTKVLEPGERFSRLWNHEGLWLPVDSG